MKNKQVVELFEYDAKLLTAFWKALDGDKKFFDFLLVNYPELAALSGSIHGDTEARQWLLDNGYPEFAVLSNAIDNEPYAYAWMKKYKLNFSLIFVDACRAKQPAIDWLRHYDLIIFVELAHTIREIILKQADDTLDYHKFRRK